MYSSVEELALAAGLQALSVMPRNRTGFFQDVVVNTRQNLEHVRYSKTGSEGVPLTVQTNHFQVTCPQQIAYKYIVDYRPDIEDMKLRTQLLFQHERIFGECHIFDGNSLLLLNRLQSQEVQLVSQTRSRSIVKITLQLSKELQPNHPDCLRYYNILFKKTLEHLHMRRIGRNYYSKWSKPDLEKYKVQVFPGYSTSILPYECSLTLCADLNHKLVRMETAYDLIMRLYEQDEENFKENVEKELVGLIVFAQYNNRNYRVDGIDWNQNPKHTFTKSDGSQVAFADYYLEKYNVHVTDLTQPLLISGSRWRKGRKLMPRSTIMLVPQLCYLTGLSDAMRRNSFMMKSLSKHLRPTPPERVAALEEFVASVKGNWKAQRELQCWHLNLAPDRLNVSGRILNKVRIFQHQQSFEADPLSTDWLKGSRYTSLLRVIPITKWILLYTRSCVDLVSSLLFSLNKVTYNMGMTIGNAETHEVDDDPSSYLTALQKFVTKDTQMVVCILPNEGKTRYDEIKKYLCVQCPTPSQCVVAHTLDKPQTLMTMTAKIAQQMNCKMGGALWKVDTGLTKTMFIGIDCFHDIANRRRSTAAFVASTDEELTKWYSQCIFQETGEELVDGLKSCLKAALSSWIQNVPCAPRSVVVYRDGVGDGQLQALLDHEVPQLVSCLEDSCTPGIKLTFIVVKKRINTRFFSNNFENPPPGTVVDRVITREQWYDFYIVSQFSKSGTVTPTHYNVIYDTVRLDPDTVQRLTYKLCHMYYNLPGVIRVPAPCHYAHKLAYLVGQNIHQEPSELLSDTLYYL